jgi:hypothetical protein
LSVAKAQVFDQAKVLDAIPYDIPGAEYSHYGDESTFDFIIKKHQLTDPALLQLAIIIRGANTNHFELAQQSAGLWAISAGLSYNGNDDHKVLKTG